MLEMSTQGKTKKEFKFDISFEKKNEKKRNMLQTPEKNKGFPFLLLIRQDQCFPWTNWKEVFTVHNTWKAFTPFQESFTLFSLIFFDVAISDVLNVLIDFPASSNLWVKGVIIKLLFNGFFPNPIPV